jgi:hypothetical protein
MANQMTYLNTLEFKGLRMPFHYFFTKNLLI